SQQIVAAAVTVAAGLNRPRFGNVSFLAEAGQGVIFAEEGDHRTAFAPFAHHGRRNATDVFGDTKTLMAQLREMLGRRARVGVADLGHAPDPVGEGGEARLDRVHATPDIAAVVHGSAPEIEETQWVAALRAVLKLLMRGPFMHD